VVGRGVGQAFCWQVAAGVRVFRPFPNAHTTGPAA
jgi:hypothetical protein